MSSVNKRIKIKNMSRICCYPRWCYFLLLLFVIIFLYAFIFNEDVIHQESSVVCYFSKFPHDHQKLLNNLNKDTKPNDGKNIFFIETSCSSDGIVKLNARQACAIESAAKANPHHQIFVLFASPVGFRNSTPLPIIDLILSYKNVHLNYLNITQYAEKTPLEEWIKNGDLFRSTYMNAHTSDVLRYLTLWKFGGTYLDLDVVVRKPLDSIPSNYAGAETNRTINCAVLNLDQQIGFLFADKCLKNLRENFDGSDWGNNGPGVITRVLHEICQTSTVENMTKSNCHGFTVHPPDTFYAVPWQEYWKFFSEEYAHETMSKIENSLVSHVWNKFSQYNVSSINSQGAYVQLAKEFCPKAFQSTGNYF